MKKRIVMFLAAAMAAVCAWADTWTDPGTGYTWTYRINGDTAEIGTGSYSAAISPSPTGAVTIPATLGGKTVASIGDWAFGYCSGLTSVTIPDGVTSIGRDAFDGCSALTSVTIPDGVTSIGSYAFDGCSGLTSVTIPESVTRIGDMAFEHTPFYNNQSYGLVVLGKVAYGINGTCPEIVVIPDGVASISEYAFYGCSGLTSVTIPDSVTNIGHSAFYGCSGLVSVTIPSGVTIIEGFMFYGCSGLVSVTIPAGVTSIGDRAFSGCSGLTSVTIPGGVTSIGRYAFYGCAGLGSVTIPDSVTIIGDYAFYGCRWLKNVTIPAGVTSIGDYVFYDCRGITRLTIPGGVRSIGRYAFYHCINLSSVTMPNSLTHIGDRAFCNCSGLTRVTIPNGVASIGSGAFSGCSGLMSVTIPNSVTSIEEHAFDDCNSSLYDTSTISGARMVDGWIIGSDYSLSGRIVLTGVRGFASSALAGCYGLTSVTIPNSVTSIGSSALAGCYGLTSVTIPNSVTHIGDGAFCNCSGLTSVTIPDSVTSIGNGTFSGCSGLMSVTIPNSVKNIGERAFYGCSGLTSVTMPNGVTSIGSSMFENCSGLTSVTIPNGVTSIGSCVFSGCSGLVSIMIPNSVTNIGDSVFSGCNALTSMTAPQSLCSSRLSNVFPDVYATIKEITIVDGVTSIGSCAFYGCSGLTSVTIPNSVTNIGDRAFYGCRSLVSVHVADLAAWCEVSFDDNPLSYAHNLYVNDELTVNLSIPIGVTSISRSAFSGCSGLKSVIIPNSVTNIGNSAFSGCSGLKSVIIPDSVTNIGNSTFSGCGGLMSVNIPDSVTSIGYDAFYGCSGLTSVRIPNSVTCIGNAAFRRCRNLASVALPNGVTNIGYAVFSGCSGLTSVTIPDSVTSIDYAAFYDCSSLTSVTIPNGVISIGDFAFDGCSRLTSLAIPDGVTNIGSYAFGNCSGLTSLTIPDSANIGDCAFLGCSGLTSVTIPQVVCSSKLSTFFPSAYQSMTNVVVSDSVTSLGESVFQDCSSLVSVSMPNSVMSIGDYAFRNCGGLESVTIGNGVASIGHSVFSGCSGLMTIEVDAINANYLSINGLMLSKDGKILLYGVNGDVAIPNCVTSIWDSAFFGCAGLTSVSIPNSVTSIKSYAFRGCSGLTSVVIPESVTCIGVGAFDECVGLTNLVIRSDSVALSQPGLSQAKFNTRFDTSSTFNDSDEVSKVSGVIAAYQKVEASPWQFSDPVTGATYAWNAGNTTFAYFGVMYMEAGKTYVFGAHFDDDAYVKVDGQVLINVSASSGYAVYTGSYSCSASGWHDVEFRLGDISGGKGSWGNLWSSDFGLGYRDDGSTATAQGGWKRLIDPGDGSLLRNKIVEFAGCRNLKSVTMPWKLMTQMRLIAPDSYDKLERITLTGPALEIPAHSFDGCAALRAIEIPSTVTNIGESAFAGCASLSAVNIPSGVTSIGDFAFSGCSGLTSVTMPDSVTSIGENAFSGCGGLANVSIGNGVTSIGDSAFLGCTNLTNVTIPDGVTSIGDSAFSGCIRLSSVAIPDSVTRIGNAAFSDCADLSSIMIPDSVTHIGSRVFEGCIGLVSVTVPQAICDSTADEIFSSACQSITNVVISSAVTNIGNRAFSGCCCLTSVTIPDSVTTIGEHAFSGCSWLTSVTIPDSVTSIGSGAFSGCSGLEEMSLPFVGARRGNTGSRDSLFGYIFGTSSYVGGASTRQYCTGSTYSDYYIPSKLRKVELTDERALGYGAFYNCSGLVNVTIPAGVTTIGMRAFYGCSGLTSVIIPESVTNIGSYAFCNCNGLADATIPTSVKTIEARVFYGCSGLTSVIIPESVTNIGSYAFCNCSRLADVTIPAGVTTVGTRAFYGCSGLASVIIPESVTSIGIGAFDECIGLTNLVIRSGSVNLSQPGLRQAKFNTRFDRSSTLEDSDEVADVSGVIAAYQKVEASPWRFSDPVTGATYAWNAGNTTFAYFGVMYMEVGKTYVFGAHFDDDAYVKVDGQVLINVATSSGATVYTGSYSCSVSGWHEVEFRLGDISGGKGSWGNYWSSDFGLGYRDDGSTATAQGGWKRLIDPGDGSLLRSKSVFADCRSLKSVTMPWKAMTQMRFIVPESYDKLETITLTGSALGVPDHSFDGCAALRAIEMPSTVTNIGESAFAGCASLSAVNIPSGVTSIDDFAFSGCSGLVRVTIPNSVTSIGENVFSGCSGLTSVAMPDSVTSIGENAFSGCGNLTSVTVIECMAGRSMSDWFPDSYGKIRHIDFVGNISSLPDQFFDGCDSLESVSVAESVSGFGNCDMRWAVDRNAPDGLFIKDGWVFGWVGDEPSSIEIPEGVKGIAPYALCGFYDLESVSLPSTLRYIGAKAFAGDSYLDNIVIPDGVETIGDGAFEDCSYIQTLTIGGGVKAVGRRAFAGCTQLASAEFADGLCDVGEEAFSNCWRMASVSLPLSTTNVGSMAFIGCTSLTGVTTPTSHGTMAEWFASVHQNIKSVMVPEDEKIVVSNMFDGCASLTALQLPDGIEDIGESAFRDCTSLTEMAIPGGVARLGAGAFCGCSQIETLTLPNGLPDLPDNVFAGCDAIDSFVVPASVTNLGSRFCSSGTTAIYYLGNAPAYSADAYADAPAALTSYVVRGTKGWDGRPTSRDIPQTWIGHAITTWEATRFDVTFDANDGKFMPEDADTFAREEITDTGYSLPPNEPVRPGYKFTGYWTAATGGSRVTSATRVTLTKAHTLFAQWRICAKVTVRFNACGGTVSPGEGSYTSEASYGELPAPTREHFRFAGWWTVANGGTEVTIASEVPKADHELFAHWTPAPCVVRFHACNGTNEARDQEFVYGEPVTLDANAFTRDGYAFAGWATTEGGASVYPDRKTLEDVPGMQNDVLHLYATWVSTRYAVRFDANGGVGRMDSQAFVRDIETNLVTCAFTRTGYEFAGWGVSATGPVVYGDGASVTNVYEQTGSDVALYAVWVPIEYSIQYDPNGGTGEMADQPMVYDVAAPLVESRFTMAGSMFCGWATAAGGSVAYREQASVMNLSAVADDVVTLYVVWQEKTAAVLVCEDAFGGVGTVSMDDDGNAVVTLTNDVSGTVEIPDNVGNVTIDLNGHDMVGDGGRLGEAALPGGPAIRIVSGEGEGETTWLAIVDTSDSENGQVAGGGDAAGIEVAEDAASDVKLDVEEGVSVLNGDGTEQEFKPKLVGTGTVTVPKTWKTGQKVTWKAKADKGSVFARWEGPLVDSLGLSRNERRNPSLAFAVPDGFETNQVTAVFIPIDDDGLYELALTQTEFELKAAVAGVWVTDDSESYVTASASGLPAGLKLDAKTLRITGAPTKSGVYWVQIKAKNASGYQWAENVKVTVSGGGKEAKEPKLARTPYYPLTVLSTNAAAGTMTGTGVYAEGKKAAIKATAAKGYVFAGWYADSRLTTPATFATGDFRTASQSVVVPEMRYVFARFVTAEEDKAGVSLAVDGTEIEAAGAGRPPYQTNVMCGVYMEWPVAVEALSLPTVAVSGLPTGLKFTAKPVTSKIGSGKAAVVVTNVPANTIYGTPTAASKVDAKTGAVKPSVVKVTVTTAGKAKVAYEIDVTVDAVKEWAVGTFDGAAFSTGETPVVPGDAQQRVPPAGLVQAFTVSAAGKISGKVLEGDKTWTLSAANFDAYDAEAGVYTATVVGKSGKEAVTNVVTIAEEEVRRVEDAAPYRRGVVTGDGWTAWQNLWKAEPWKTDAKPFAKAPALTLHVVEGELVAATSAALPSGTISLKFASSGAVTASGKFVTGQDAKGKDVVYSASCSSVLVPAGTRDACPYRVYLYFPPKAGKFDGYAAEISLVWDGAAFSLAE